MIKGIKIKSISFKLVIFSLMAVMVFILSLPLLSSKFNYTPFKAFGVEIAPSKTYKIVYDLPHLSKKITPSTRKKAETNLSKVFNIPLSSLKQNEYLSKPVVYITYIPFINRYRGFIKIGNTVSQFKTIKTIPDNLNLDSSFLNNNTQSTLILTCYFTLNNIPFRSNIFILNNGSILQYSSMTIQDSNDNVIGMFTYGKNKATKKVPENSIIHKPVGIDNNSESIGYSKEIVLRSYIKDITIDDPFGSNYRNVHGLRTDAMVNSPFTTSNNVDNMISIRSWGFRKQIIDVYKSFYEAEFHGDTAYVNVDITNIDDVLETEYQSMALETNQYRFPFESNYTTLPINVSFNLSGINVSYTINIPIGGVKKSWIYKQTYGNIQYFNNYAELNANSFYLNWSDSKLFWPDYDNNPYISNPGGSYGGFYARQFFKNESYGSGFYARYTSSYTYCVRVSMAFTGTDYYFFTVYNTFDNVCLDR